MKFSHGYIQAELQHGRAALANNRGTFDLSNWAIFTGSGEISDNPSGNAYLTRVANDNLSHASGPYTNVGRFHNHQATTFRVQRLWTTVANTLYDIDFDISFLAAGNRVSIRVFDGAGAAITAALTPFTSAQSINFNFTTPAGAAGTETYLRINEFTTGVNTGCFITDPVLS